MRTFIRGLFLMMISLGLFASNENCSSHSNQKIEFREFEKVLSVLQGMSESKVAHTGDITKKSMILLKKKINRKIAEAKGGPVKINILLNSLGGEIYWSYDMLKFIKKLNRDPKIVINTEVRNSCESSCTILFTGGKNRYASRGARFGFHKPTLHSAPFHNMTKGEIENMFRKIWVLSVRDVDPKVAIYLNKNEYFKYQQMKYLGASSLLTGYVTEVR